MDSGHYDVADPKRNSHKEHCFIASSTDVSWDAMTELNKSGDVLNKTMQSLETKRGRGRPKKLNSSNQNMPELPSYQAPVAMQPTQEEMMNTTDLLQTLVRSSSTSPRKKKSTSSLRFSQETVAKGEDQSSESTGPEDPDRATLLKLYRQYFKEPLIGKHKRKEKIWTESNFSSEIYREIKELESAVSDDDPTTTLAGFWVGCLGVVEASGPALGLQTQGLTIGAFHHSQDQKFKANMRELLIKYPYLRTMIGLGGYPELKLLLTTVTLVREVHSLNTAHSQHDAFQKPGDDLRKEFDEL